MVDAFYEKFKSQVLTISDCNLCPCKADYSGIGEHCNYYNEEIVDRVLEEKPKWCKIRHIIVIKER